MEDKNNHPSLPPNYISLAQLQERWLKQKEKENQLQEKQQEEPQQKQQQQIPKLPQHNPRECHVGGRPKAQQQAWRAIPAHPTGLGHAAVECPPAKSGPKNPNVPVSNRVAVEVSCETNGSVEAKADIGDGNDGQDGKKKQSKKKWRSGKGKARAATAKKQLAEGATESTMMGSKEVVNSDEKTETKIDLKDSKSKGLMMNVEQKLGAISMNSKNEKRNSRVKTNDGSRGSQGSNGGCYYRIGPHGRADKEKKKLAEDATQSTMVGNKEVANSDFQRVDDKRETKIELNGSKSNNLMSDVEQKLGAISMNSENEKQNSRVKTNDSSRGSQGSNGGCYYRIGPHGRADKEKKKLAEDATQSTMVGNKEVANSDFQRVDDKRETKIELNGSKSNNLMSDVEQKLGAISMNSENEKQNSRGKTNDSSRGSPRINGGCYYRIGPHGRADKEKKKLVEDATQSTMVGNKEVVNSDFQRVDDKRETKIELNGSKSNNLMSDVEQKLGAISMNCENERENSRVKTCDTSCGTQRNIGGRNYRTGPYGSRIRAHEVQWRRADQKIWVRKSEDSNGNVDHNGISSK
ncbi:hypothetical protein QN277_015403 [Acacia crassicarpa]|uniref:Uncharacterized protein n=1 Tax=Acacia crassicarpa TaxID=499986 RepID=A0AAE1KK94_9FABA|nr:hypothetical protein QN277_015403 [Acacia crassicarpa]